MQARVRVLLLALVTAAVFVAVGTAATSSNAGAAANYIVLYKSQSVPNDAAAAVCKKRRRVVLGNAERVNMRRELYLARQNVSSADTNVGKR